MTCTAPKHELLMKHELLLCSVNQTFASMKEVAYDMSLAESSASKRAQQQ